MMNNVKIITWNINSIRARILQLLSLIEEFDPDILLIQELKCINDEFPKELNKYKYHLYLHGEKSFNGVCIFSKFEAYSIRTNFITNIYYDEARFIEVDIYIPNIGSCNIISLYAPHGYSTDSSNFIKKLKFYDNFLEYLINKKSFNTNTIIGGDFNIAPFDIDVFSPIFLNNAIGFTIEEKRKMRSILNNGFDDIYRSLNKFKQEFSWWSYKNKSFDHDHGMRIDTLLCSSNLVSSFSKCNIIERYRSFDKPSDHAPVIAYCTI